MLRTVRRVTLVCCSRRLAGQRQPRLRPTSRSAAPGRGVQSRRSRSATRPAPACWSSAASTATRPPGFRSPAHLSGWHRATIEWGAARSGGRRAWRGHERAPVRSGRFLAGLLWLFMLATAASAEALNPQVAGLQVALRSHGLYRGPIDAIAGAGTLSALVRFQRQVGIVPHGIAGPRTRTALGSLGQPLYGTRMLRRGMVGWDVSALQFLLARDGFSPRRDQRPVRCADRGGACPFPALRRPDSGRDPRPADGQGPAHAHVRRFDPSPASRLRSTSFAPVTRSRRSPSTTTCRSRNWRGRITSIPPRSSLPAPSCACRFRHTKPRRCIGRCRRESAGAGADRLLGHVLSRRPAARARSGLDGVRL